MRGFDPELRERVVANLAAFRRQEPAHPKRWELDGDLRHAAVALTLVGDTEGQACFVITRRSETLRNHGGQWALPGGRIDAGETPEQTALRELREEVSLEVPPHQVLGRLDDFVTRSGFLIAPVVVWGEGAGEAIPNPAEVAAVYRVPLSDLDEPNVPELTHIPESDRPLLGIPFACLGTTIMSPTAAMIFQMREVALYGRDTRVSHYEQPIFAWS